MFTIIDLIAPWGICIVCSGLSLLAAVIGKAKNITAARVISISTAVVFLSGIPLWYVIRSNTIKEDYTTRYGIKVKVGEKNTCKESVINDWTEWLLTFWGKHYDPKGVKDSVKGILVVCVDKEKLSVLGRAVRGYSHGKFSIVGYNGKPEYSEALFKHEVSHQIVKPFVPYDENGHHALFKEKNLGY